MTARTWQLRSKSLGVDTERWQLLSDADEPLPFETVVGYWATDASFREYWISILRLISLGSYVWECPPLTAMTATRPFECVFVSSPSLARMPVDPDAFGEHFRPGCRAVTFGNLGGDAVLVAPCPAGPDSDYGHLAQFVRTASPGQQHATWRAVGEAMEARLNADPTWLSTAGHGVGWLHIRLDSSPKYYRHAEYRRA